ncbi:DUF4442 domain-containing protein [Haloprofundus marisrubri]|uniref:DUF4442 domain-containing protein n=1 Tax=Haloprofundus marisrubri TaxID=1514971 RepID=A0A0W1RC70_9EURY|nr:DUF4442 domain-containing protein [Haloprofundus marisrubri]KTG10966.1 DUF4442 domain-containing protein [Haloprofundus marisrubri]
MSESLRTRLSRLGFNLHPTYRSTGGRVRYIERDWSRIQVELPLTWRTKNVYGTMFGGSMYAAVDPVYVIMLNRRLGDEFTVWDRAANIEFKRPGDRTLYADFRVPDEEVEAIRETLEPGESTDREYDLQLFDADGDVYAEVSKTLYVRRDE